MEYGYCFWYEDGQISSIPSQVKKLGLDYGEVSLTYPWPDMVPRSEIPITKKELETLGVRFAFHGPLEGLFLFNPRKEIAKAATSIHVKCLEFAAQLDPLYYTFHIKADPMTLRIEGKDIGLQRCLNGLDKLIESAHKLDIRLVVENSSNTAYLVPIQDLLSRELDFNLDIGHWFKGGRGYDRLSHLIKDVGDRVVLLHLHDTRYQDTPAEDHLPLGHGDIDFARVFNILKGSAIQWINLETISSEQDVVPESLSKAKKLASIMQDI
jgi:sugar phosphate isomerase/epimerase